ncbi:hypothetical protein BsWGS_27472 [Bradybaena similaris]
MTSCYHLCCEVRSFIVCWQGGRETASSDIAEKPRYTDKSNGCNKQKYQGTYVKRERQTRLSNLLALHHIQ